MQGKHLFIVPNACADTVLTWLSSFSGRKVASAASSEASLGTGLGAGEDRSKEDSEGRGAPEEEGVASRDTTGA